VIYTFTYNQQSNFASAKLTLSHYDAHNNIPIKIKYLQNSYYVLYQSYTLLRYYNLSYAVSYFSLSNIIDFWQYSSNFNNYIIVATTANIIQVYSVSSYNAIMVHQRAFPSGYVFYSAGNRMMGNGVSLGMSKADIVS